MSWLVTERFETKLMHSSYKILEKTLVHFNRK